MNCHIIFYSRIVTWASQEEAEEGVVVVVAALKEAVVVEVADEEDTGSLTGLVASLVSGL